MKKSFILFCFLLAYSTIFAQGIVFEKGSWEEALAKAKAENKLLFVDLYTSWCGPCKIVAKNVFPNEKVGNYYNEHFVNYQLDGEKGDGPAVVKKYEVHGYPTFLYLDGDGKVVYRFSGAKDSKSFLAEAAKVAVCARYGGWDKMQADYASGKGNEDFMWDYYELADREDKPVALNAYLMSLPDQKLFTAEVGKLLDTEVTLYDYKLLDRLVEGRVRMGQQDQDFDFMFTFPLQWKLTELFNESIREGNKERFDELLTLKRKLSILPGSNDPDIDISWGRGLFFASEDLLNLCYLYQNQNDDTLFCTLFETYMDRLCEENPLDSIAAKRKVDEKMVLDNPKIASLLDLDDGQKLIASYVLDWTDYYWRMMPSDKITRTRCAAWTNYACRINPYNPETPLKAASLLLSLKQEKEALAYLQQAIEKYKFIHSEDEEYYKAKNDLMIKKLNDKIRDIKNKKE